MTYRLLARSLFLQRQWTKALAIVIAVVDCIDVNVKPLEMHTIRMCILNFYSFKVKINFKVYLNLLNETVRDVHGARHCS